MPILKEKPVLSPKPPCGGCDFCGDCREDGLYLLGYKDKYYCHKCFKERAQDWPMPKADSWIDNPEKFKRRWETGESYTSQIAARLREDGLTVQEPERSFRQSFDDRKRYKDEVDLIVNGHRIEVKSRRHYWTTLSDFPYESIFVDTVKKWDGHKTIPLATINVSQKTGATIIVPAKTKDRWTVVRGKDRDSEYSSDFYSAPQSTWTTYEKLVEYLKENPK